MRLLALFVWCIYVATFIFCIPDMGFARKKKDRARSDFQHADLNQDGKIDPGEWNRRGNFKRLDQNSDNFLSLPEVRQMYKGHNKRSYTWPPEGLKKLSIDIDETVQKDLVNKELVDEETICSFAWLMQCGVYDQVKRGLLATGTGPVFPANTNCYGSDDYWAMDYSHKRNRKMYHGGIDLPAPWGTPMLAVAAGSVVAMYTADKSKRGNEVYLRHSPNQTGLPMWTYSAYGHLDKLPEFKIGQRIQMGQIIGPTGNSGISGKGQMGGNQSKSRRPAIHLAFFYSLSPKYTEVNNTIVPVDGFWLDPMAFYRQKPPFESKKVKQLPENEKKVLIPVLLKDGTVLPSDTRVIWPYSCH